MAIAEVSRKRTVFGNKVNLFITGTFQDDDTTGDIVTGLSAIDFATAQYVTGGFHLNCSVSGGTVTLATEDAGGEKTWTMWVVGH
jgi:hypothetical protein